MKAGGVFASGERDSGEKVGGKKHKTWADYIAISLSED